MLIEAKMYRSEEWLINNKYSSKRKAFLHLSFHADINIPKVYKLIIKSDASRVFYWVGIHSNSWNIHYEWIQDFKNIVWPKGQICAILWYCTLQISIGFRTLTQVPKHFDGILHLLGISSLSECTLISFIL